jgi:hypothetical protein
MDTSIKRVIIGIVVIAAIATLIGGIGDLILNYWPIALLLAAAVIGGFVYLKRQKRIRNTV